MTQPQFLQRLVGGLNDAGIPFMVVGSLASSFHGEPRSTYDVDVVIDPTLESLSKLIDQIGHDCYVDRNAATRAFQTRSMFNVVHLPTGIKADLIVRKDQPFSKTEFDRRIPAQLMGVDVDLASAEDTILSKLQWSRLGESERQFRDALRVAQVMFATLDFEYLEHWSEELGVEELYRRLLRDMRRFP